MSVTILGILSRRRHQMSYLSHRKLTEASSQKVFKTGSNSGPLVEAHALMPATELEEVTPQGQISAWSSQGLRWRGTISSALLDDEYLLMPGNVRAIYRT